MALYCEQDRVLKPANEQKENSELWIPMATPHNEVDKLIFSKDPMPEIIALYNAFTNNAEIYSAILDKTTHYFKLDISPEDVENAEKIQRHFKNKLMMMRLQGFPVSSFQRKAEEILENPLVLKGNSVSVICKLYDFYKEDKALDDVIVDATSFEPPKHLDYFELEGEVTFAGSVKRRSKNERFTTYYFLTASNKLIAKEVQAVTGDIPVWDYVAKQGKLKLRCSAMCKKLPGRKFIVAKIVKDNYEILN